MVSNRAVKAKARRRNYHDLLCLHPPPPRGRRPGSCTWETADPYMLLRQLGWLVMVTTSTLDDVDKFDY